MKLWADEQGFKPALTLTDDGRKLTAGQIAEAVSDILQDGPPEQLLIYFAGHGVNLGRREYWLLSDAPRYTSEAVNVAGSAQLARTCGVEHIVFIADACRTAAAGIHMEGITGYEIFPQDELAVRPGSVDLFYATRLGDPSYERRKPEDAATGYSAVYTATLLEALRGQPSTVLEWDDRADPPVGLVRPRPLSDHLEQEVARRSAQLDEAGSIVQTPESIITSRPTAWLARIADPPRSRPGTAGPVAVVPTVAQQVGVLARDALREVLDNVDETLEATPPEEATGASAPRPRRRAWRWLAVAGAAAGAGGPVVAVAAAAAAWYASGRRTSAPFGPDQVATGCGIKVEGADVVWAYSPGADVERVGPDGRLVRVRKHAGAPATVLLQFRDGTSVMLPALDDFLAAVRMENGELFEISYEPSANSRRFTEDHNHLDTVRSLRALLLNCRQHGVLRMSGEQAEALSRLVHTGIGVDPSLTLHAGYVFHDLHRDDLLRDLLDLLDRDPGVALFDVALLAHGLSGEADRVLAVPMIPLLAEGWALLDAYRVPLSPQVNSLREHLVPSLWTHIDASGFEHARVALESTGGFR